MEAVKMKEAVPCRCGGQARVLGPCEFAPRSHWVVYCSKDSCDQMASSDNLEEAIESWNHALVPVCSWSD